MRHGSTYASSFVVLTLVVQSIAFGQEATTRIVQFPDQFEVVRRRGRPSTGTIDRFTFGRARTDHDFDHAARPGQLSSFSIHVDEREEWIPTWKLRWTVRCHVEDGELFPLLGAVYRWNGDRGEFLRLPNHRLSVRSHESGRLFSTRGSLSISRAGHEIQLTTQIEKFERYFVGARSGRRIQVAIIPTEQLLLPQEFAGKDSARCWLNEGDRIQTKSWDLTLSRIVMPDPTDKNPGWADFILRPGPEARPDKKP